MGWDIVSSGSAVDSSAMLKMWPTEIGTYRLHFRDANDDEKYLSLELTPSEWDVLLAVVERALNEVENESGDSGAGGRN